LTVQVSDQAFITLHIALNHLEELLHIVALSIGHLVLQIDALFLDLIILNLNFSECAQTPLHGFLLGACGNIKQFSFFFISGFSKFPLYVPDVFEVFIFDGFSFNGDLHLTQFGLHLVKTVSDGLFLSVLRFKISQLNC
jgi:hypothetical protein